MAHSSDTARGASAPRASCVLPRWLALEGAASRAAVCTPPRLFLSASAPVSCAGTLPSAPQLHTPGSRSISLRPLSACPSPPLVPSSPRFPAMLRARARSRSCTVRACQAWSSVQRASCSATLARPRLHAQSGPCSARKRRPRDRTHATDATRQELRPAGGSLGQLVSAGRRWVQHTVTMRAKRSCEQFGGGHAQAFHRAFAPDRPLRAGAQRAAVGPRARSLPSPSRPWPDAWRAGQPRLPRAMAHRAGCESVRALCRRPRSLLHQRVAPLSSCAHARHGHLGVTYRQRRAASCPAARACRLAPPPPPSPFETATPGKNPGKVRALCPRTSLRRDK